MRKLVAVAFGVILGLVSACPAFAAPIDDSRAWFASLSEEEREGVQYDLVLLGHFPFIIDPNGHIAYFVVSPMNVGRSVEETLRVLAALQSGRLCPADWQPGEPTLDPALRY